MSERSRAGLALSHPLNLLLVAGAGVSALLTGSWIPLAVAGATELVWALVGPRLHGQRRYYEALVQAAARSEATRGEQKRLRGVSESDRRRFLELDRLRQDIEKLATDNPSLSQEMMQGELTKVQQLVDAFLRMAEETARLDAFLEGTDLDAIEADVRTQRAVVDKTADPEARALAAQNLEVMTARLERAAELSRRTKIARGQLNLIENTMALLRDQVATMKDPEEIAGRLDDLVGSVAAIEASVKETEAVEARARAAAAERLRG